MVTIVSALALWSSFACLACSADDRGVDSREAEPETQSSAGVLDALLHLKEVGAEYDIHRLENRAVLSLNLLRADYGRLNWNSIQRLPNVVGIRVGGDNFTGHDLHSMHGFSSLIGLEISDSPALKMNDFRHLSSLNLQHLIIRDVHGFTDEGLGNLSGLPELQRLELSGTPVLRIRDLAKHPQIRHLIISGSWIEDAALEPLAQLSELRELHLYRNEKLNGSFLNDLASLENLSNLNLRYSAITDEGLNASKALGQIESLALDGTHVTDAGLRNLEGWDQLTTLFLNPEQLGAHAAATLKKLPKFREIHLMGSELSGSPITDQTATILQVISNLQSIRLRGPQQLTARGLEKFSRLRQLKRLEITNASRDKETRDSVLRLKERLPNLSVIMGQEEF